MPQHTMTIRLGAAHWDATVCNGAHFDFRKMTGAERKEWYGRFMAACRRIYGGSGSQHGTRK
jgi:hypothetical protein